MPAVDVDVTTIPDMIEAQLTLSYSRLAHLVRLIVDQGNGHDVDIDKMNNRMDALARENAELRALLESLVEKNSRESWFQTELDELRGEVARVSDSCAENSNKLVSVTEEIQSRFDETEKRLKAETTTRANEVERFHLSVGEVQSAVRDMGGTLKHLQNFVDVWEGKPEKTEALTTRDAAGAFQHSTENRVEYLRSLPVFASVFDEVDVLRQMLRQQAADSLSAKTAAGAIRRFSAAEVSASGVSDANKVDRDAISGLQESLGGVLQRLKRLEGGLTPAFGQAKARPQQTPVHLSAEVEDISRLEKRLQQVENRLRSLSFQASDGGGAEKANLLGLNGRLWLAESGAETLPLQQLPQKEGETLTPGMPGRQPFRTYSQSQSQLPSQSQSQPRRSASASFGRHAPAPVGREGAPGSTGEGLALPQLQAVSSKGRNETSDPQALQGAGGEAPNPGDSAAHPTEVEAGRLRTSPPHSQAAAQNDEIQLRIARLEEGSTLLEMKKADRQELAQLEDALRQIVQNQALQPGSPLLQALMPRRPMSQQESRGMNAIESAYYGSLGLGPRSATPGRPVFVGGAAYSLRDNTGAVTPATVSSSHLL
ncbi:uncharacterized protein Tco025E_09113 [Trypanosoma conorhini]|uniref:Uncharacterized protein n=1 Tax=Trypanosoma conorhini TaxID=83891 RepID=A0A3R7JYQ1_9TRYP|nr:uncharacterized protein Tco025E_09113 [Trypanosoma conorhini]RNE98995.1 hypothetical protein Tco025E_09113 [Trypanosoma conorhini]